MYQSQPDVPRHVEKSIALEMLSFVLDEWSILISEVFGGPHNVLKYCCQNDSA